jgi:hypothetical protein
VSVQDNLELFIGILASNYVVEGTRVIAGVNDDSKPLEFHILRKGKDYCLFHMTLPNKEIQYNLMPAVKLP